MYFENLFMRASNSEAAAQMDCFGRSKVKLILAFCSKKVGAAKIFCISIVLVQIFSKLYKQDVCTGVVFNETFFRFLIGFLSFEKCLFILFPRSRKIFVITA